MCCRTYLHGLFVSTNQTLFCFLQLDADRDEEEVFYDISMTVDNKLYPTKEPVAGKTSSIISWEFMTYM